MWAPWLPSSPGCLPGRVTTSQRRRGRQASTRAACEKMVCGQDYHPCNQLLGPWPGLCDLPPPAPPPSWPSDEISLCSRLKRQPRPPSAFWAVLPPGDQLAVLGRQLFVSGGGSLPDGVTFMFPGKKVASEFRPEVPAPFISGLRPAGWIERCVMGEAGWCLRWPLAWPAPPPGAVFSRLGSPALGGLTGREKGSPGLPLLTRVNARSGVTPGDRMRPPSARGKLRPLLLPLSSFSLCEFPQAVSGCPIRLALTGGGRRIGGISRRAGVREVWENSAGDRLGV